MSGVQGGRAYQGRACAGVVDMGLDTGGVPSASLVPPALGLSLAQARTYSIFPLSPCLGCEG